TPYPAHKSIAANAQVRRKVNGGIGVLVELRAITPRSSPRLAGLSSRRAYAKSTLRADLRTEASAAERRPVLRVGDVLHPGDVAAVERLLHGDVDHRGLGRGPVPVLFIRRDPHGIARADLTHRAAPQLDAADAGDDVQGLAERMGVPRRARAGLEAHPRR